ncbi:MAG TPA: cation/multidrug efflux pump [Spongiibacteraceae bacterium]|nr:cation/multidrug efflux pump [Spongiibacteraceae bacterium]HCS25943.1 cation/multidrug efflux pump [Spongiibacteraceae bacterium]
MSILMLVASLVLLALPLGFIAFRLLMNIPVLKHFLVGSVAVMCALLALTALLSAWDLYSYRALLEETPVATVDFRQRGPQHYEALVTVGEESLEYQLFGDQWQLDARMIKWGATMARLGLDPVFRLERISGRYQALDDERNKPRSVHAIQVSEVFDVWQWLKRGEPLLKFADAEYGTATYLPMANGARYQVTISNFGLLARPENREAEMALDNWSS